MKALVFHGPRSLRWEDWPDPVVGDGDVLVAVRAVGICGSDLHGYTGDSGRRIPPMVMGHEFTGEVIAPGRHGAHFQTGTRVVVRPFLHCGRCEACAAGRTNLCANRVYLGANANGAMASRIAVPADNLLPLGDHLSFAHGTLAEPLAVAIHAARQAGDLSNRRVLVVGCGTIGLLTMIAAKRSGAAHVIAVDPKAERRQAALAMAADAALDPNDANFCANLIATSRAGDIDAAFDAVGIAQTFGQCIDTIRPGGTIVAIGGWKTVPVDLSKVVSREIVVRGSFNFTPADFATASAWLENGLIDCASLVTTTFPMTEGGRVFEDIVERRIDGIKVVLVNEAST